MPQYRERRDKGTSATCWLHNLVYLVTLQKMRDPVSKKMCWEVPKE